MDIFMGQTEWEKAPVPRIRTQTPRISPDRDEVRRAIEVLSQAQRPMLMAGTSVKWSRASGELVRFIREIHLPSFTNGMGRGTIPPDTPEWLNRSRRDALKKTDCIVLAGTLLDFRLAASPIPSGAGRLHLST